MTVHRLQRVLCSLLCCLATGCLYAQTQLVFNPHWTAQAQFAGYYVAEANGFYRDAGLQVKIEHSTAGSTLLERVKRGENVLVSLQLTSAMKLIDEGCQLVNVLQYFQRNSQLVVAHKPLTGVKSLNGMRIGHFRNGSSELLFAMARQYALQVECVPFLSNTNLFVSGAIDATLAMSYNELHQLKLAGQRISSQQILRMEDIGYDVPEDGLYVNADYYRSHKAEVDRFAEATRKGWEWAAAHPDDALEIVMVYIKQNGVASNRIVQRCMLKECIQLLSEKKTGRRSYQLSQEGVERANRILTANGIIRTPVTYQQITKP